MKTPDPFKSRAFIAKTPRHVLFNVLTDGTTISTVLLVSGFAFETLLISRRYEVCIRTTDREQAIINHTTVMDDHLKNYNK